MRKLLALVAVCLMGAGPVPPYSSGSVSRVSVQGTTGPTGATGPQGPAGVGSMADGGVIQGALTVQDSSLFDGGIKIPAESLIDFNPADGGNTFIYKTGNNLVLHQDTSLGIGYLSGAHWHSQFDLVAGDNYSNKAGLRGGNGADVFITSDWSSGSNEGIDTAMNGTGTFQVNGVEVPVTPTWTKDSKQAEVQMGTKACATSAWNITFADAGGVAFSATPKFCTVTDEAGSVVTITLKSATQVGGVCASTDTLDWQCWGDK